MGKYEDRSLIGIAAWFKGKAVSGNTSRLVMCAMCNAMHCVQGTRWRFAQKLQSYDCQNGGDAAEACNRLLNHAGMATSNKSQLSVNKDFVRRIVVRLNSRRAVSPQNLRANP